MFNNRTDCQEVLGLRAVFLDRDGIIGGTGDGMHPFEFTIIKFSIPAVKFLTV